MLKKILITGVFGTGKTTLVNQIAEWGNKRDFKVKIGLEVARTSPFALNREQTDHGTAWLLLRQLLTESEITLGDPRVFVGDRGIIDILAHLMETEARLAKKSSLVAIYREAMIASVRSYDLIFRTHPGKLYLPEDDGVRSGSLAYQIQMEEFHDRAINELDVACVPLPDGLEQRMDVIIPHLL
nr:AAA family ATPase [uncultured Shinella sp.]